MKFSIGDRVILKTSGEEGFVTAIINEQMAEVDVDGVSFPVYIDDIDHPYLKWFTEKTKSKPRSKPEQLPVEKEKNRIPKLAKGVYLSFLPVYKPEAFEDIVDQMKIYLQNELPRAIYFKYEVINKHQQQVFKHEGKLHAFGHLYMHSVSFDDMNDQPRFNYELTDADNVKHETVKGIIRIKPQKLFEHINELLEKNEPMFSYLCADGFMHVAKPSEHDAPFHIPKTPQPTAAKDWRTALPRFELDLHIENLVPSIQGLNNADMLHIQLEALQNHLQAVIANKQQRTVIIHGMGKGVLRDEVQKILKQIAEVSRYTSDWNANYGFGATEVWFKY